ncbi:hypothetical protein ACFVVU_22630 [Kitasatospora sp. NPDC057965]
MSNGPGAWAIGPLDNALGILLGTTGTTVHAAPGTQDLKVEARG